MTNTKLIRFTLDIVLPYPVPEDCNDKQSVEFFFNNTRLCRSQILDEIAKRICVCSESHVTFEGDATQADIEAWEGGKYDEL